MATRIFKAFVCGVKLGALQMIKEHDQSIKNVRKIISIGHDKIFQWLGQYSVEQSGQ